MPHTRQQAQQDRILDFAAQKGRALTIYLKNGVHIRGRVMAHDTFTILLETEKNRTLIYKHSTTSLFPARLPGPTRRGAAPQSR